MKRAVIVAFAALAMAGCQHLAAGEPSDARLVQNARDYAARRTPPFDPALDAQVHIERTPSQWVVWFVHELPPNTIGGDSVNFQIDRKSHRVVSMGITQ
jgi:hypothetical protein